MSFRAWHTKAKSNTQCKRGRVRLHLTLLYFFSFLFFFVSPILFRRGTSIFIASYRVWGLLSLFPVGLRGLEASTEAIPKASLGVNVLKTEKRANKKEERRVRVTWWVEGGRWGIKMKMNSPAVTLGGSWGLKARLLPCWIHPISHCFQDTFQRWLVKKKNQVQEWITKLIKHQRGGWGEGGGALWRMNDDQGCRWMVKYPLQSDRETTSSIRDSHLIEGARNDDAEAFDIEISQRPNRMVICCTKAVSISGH